MLREGFDECWQVFGDHDWKINKIKKKLKKEKDPEDIFKTSEMSKHSFETFAESQNRNNDEVTPMATTQISYLIYKEKN